MPQYFLHLSTKLLPPVVISSHMDEKQFIHKLFEEFKGKDTFFVHKLLRQKDLEKLCEIFESYYTLCVMYDQCNNSYADKTVPSCKENTHVKLIGSLFLIHYIKHLRK